MNHKLYLLSPLVEIEPEKRAVSLERGDHHDPAISAPSSVSQCIVVNVFDASDRVSVLTVVEQNRVLRQCQK